MTTKSIEAVNKTGLVPDPNSVPVVFANLFAGGGTINGVINFTLCTSRFTPSFDGPTDNDIIVASRIRLDVQAATMLRDFLSAQINLLTAPADKSQAN